MSGYWRIEKDWVTKWGLTATEAIVLADVTSYGAMLTMEERAQRCGLSLRQTKNIMASLFAKLSETDDEGAKIALCRVQKLHPKSAKIALSKVQKLHSKGAKIALSPHTPFNNVEEHEERLEERGNARARVKGLSDREGRKGGDSPNVLRVFTDFYKATTGTDYQPDWKTNTTDTSALADMVKAKAPQFGVAWTKDEGERWCRQLLDAFYATMDTWQRQHLSLRLVVSQFNTLFNQATNGTNGQHSSKYPTIDAEYRAKVARELAGIALDGK